MACIKELSKNVDEIHIVCSSPEQNAPFRFIYPANVIIHQREKFSVKSLVKLTNSISPALITSSGWRDPAYLYVCRQKKGLIPTVLLMDNQYRNKFKQKFLCRVSSVILHQSFSNIWVPGPPQVNYALHLGFKPSQIIEGFYAPDTDFFNNFSSFRTNTSIFPKRFLFIGRYVSEKGIDILIDSFTQLQSENANEWELWCVGTGPLTKNIKRIPKIKHFGFLQPFEMDEVLKNCGVFVLPSRYEQWGVVLHEMAVAGFPIITSSEVGSSTKFVEEGKNGFIITNNKPDELKQVMQNFIEMPDEKLRELSKHSLNLGLSLTPAIWVNTLFGIVNKSQHT